MDGLTVAERRFDLNGAEVYTMRYYFDESNAPIGIGIQYPFSADTYWENYYFAKNAQGDIIAIYNSNNGNPNLIATYEYDAWGKPTGIYNPNGAIISQTGINAAALNPFRYRGYRYDADTGFYYLQSRYYDPVIGRFINADGLASTGQGFIGYNMFAYCNNNPVMGYDPTGAINWGGVFAGLAITVVGICALVATVYTAGAAAPLAAAAISAVGTAVGTAVTATGAVITYGGAAEETVVLDCSVTNGSTHEKRGYSVVIDFNPDTACVESYYHYGITSGGNGASYGVGLVSGYNGAGDYGGEFADATVSYTHNGFDYGVDVCTDPSDPFYGCTAALFTVGVSSPAQCNGRLQGTVGYDYYIPLCYSSW